MIGVESWGIATSVVDAGRPGRAWLGQSRGGAVDCDALALANRLVGNGVRCSGIETSGGLQLVVQRPVMIAITGALAEVTVTGGPPIGWGHPMVLPAGARLRVGRLIDGARVYLAVRGGVVRSGDELSAGIDPAVPAATVGAPRRSTPTTLRVWPGPRSQWFDDSAWSALLAGDYTVTSTSRVGARLAGAPLIRSHDGQLPSEGMVEGAVQVPPDGQPIIMLADHPCTGGYPVLAVVDPADLAAVAQAAPGSTLRFTLAR